ncbi:hypothetical protein EMCRGX_G007570 [Ephydatia muelleri]
MVAAVNVYGRQSAKNPRAVDFRRPDGMGHFAAHCRTRGLQLMQQKESDSSTDMDSAYLAVIGQESFWMVDIQLVATTLNSNWTRVQRSRLYQKLCTRP